MNKIRLYKSEVKQMSDNIRRKLFKAVSMVLLVMLLVLSVSAQNMFRKITDFDGDGKTDYAVARNENGFKVWYVWQSTAGFRVFQWGLETDQIVPGDYDGDGKTDFAIFRIIQVGFTGYNAFYINESSTNSLSVKLVNQSATPSDTPQQQDYDGDGKTDPATKSGLSKPGFASSIVILSSLSNSLTGGAISANYIPVRTGDMDGDSRSDVTS